MLSFLLWQHRSVLILVLLSNKTSNTESERNCERTATLKLEKKNQHYLMFSVDKADSRRQVDGRRLERIHVSAGLDGFTADLG